MATLRNLESQNQTLLSIDGLALSESQKSKFDLALKKVPTGGNCKPFSWHWNLNILKIDHSAELAQHYLNRHHVSSYLALGSLIATVDLLAQDLSLETMIHFDEKTLETLITFKKSQHSKKSTKLNFNSILKRSTYRGSFKASIAPKIKTSSQNQVQVKLLESSKVSSTLKTYLVNASQFLWKQSEATQDFFKEIRFLNQMSSSQARGIPSQELGINIFDQISLLLFSRLPKLLNFLVNHSPLQGLFRKQAKSDLKNAHLITFVAQSTHPVDLVRVGIKAYQTWLKLEGQGYKVQPFSFGTLPMVDALKQELPGSTQPFFKNLFEKEALSVLQNELLCKQNEIPIWMFRVGQ